MATYKQLLEAFNKKVEDILSSAKVDPKETRSQKEARIKRLLAPGNYLEFKKYYFPEECFSEFGWFHKSAPQYIIDHPNKVALLQWSREFGKSMESNLFLPLYLKFTGHLNGMITGSANHELASALLLDPQAHLQENPRIINDFGNQIRPGKWRLGNFATPEGIQFMAFGKDQSPRGVRFKQYRPNYGSIDDLNTKKGVKNDDISQEDYLWVKEDFLAALAAKKWWLVIPQNKFHRNTVTAKFENDQETKVYLSRVNYRNAAGESNWPEHLTTEECIAKEEALGYNSAQREYFNNPVEEGTVFKPEWFVETEPLPYDQYEHLISYTDPSYKNTAHSDYKATVLIGKKGLEYHILKAFIEKCSITQMFANLYDLHDMTNSRATHHMEANFLQDLLFTELETLAGMKGYMLPVTKDMRSKPDKFQRVEALQPIAQRGIIKINKHEKNTPGMQRLINQFSAFEKGSRVNDDGPDAVEGGIWILNRSSRNNWDPLLGGGGRKRGAW